MVTARAVVLALVATLAQPATAVALDYPPAAKPGEGQHVREGKQSDPRSISAARQRARRVKVADNFFAPSGMRVKRGTTVVWKWSRRNSQAHDVALRRGPRGVRRFRSAPAATGYTFRRRLRKPGVYRLICTFHQNMRMKIRVTR